MRSKTSMTIAVDFDGTLVEEGRDGSIKIKEGAVESLTELKSRGYLIRIFSCRVGIARKQNRLSEELSFMKEVLSEYSIPYDEIDLSDKPVAVYYIDDRAICFKNNWKKVLAEIIHQQ